MKHLMSVIFGADYATNRRGVCLRHLCAEEALMEGNCRISHDWWQQNFPGRAGVPMGALLSAASDNNATSPYMQEIVIAYCYKLRHGER